MKNKRGNHKFLHLGLMLIVFSLLYTISFAASVPSTIKVGLESIYYNATTVALSSDQNFEVGYFDEDGFSKLGTIAGNQLTLMKTGDDFYEVGYESSSLKEAQSYAQDYGKGALPVYIKAGQFGVYTTEAISGLKKAPSAPKRIKVTNGQGTIILLLEGYDQQLVFRGYDQAEGLALTKVGSTKKYRGAIGIGGTTGLTPYNVLDMEHYLYGVVPKEMSPSWPAEALKAQAVAARSIAINHYNRYISRGYNILDTTATQAYGGYVGEAASTNAAVDATKGKVLKYDGKVAEALYFSTSGGITEDPKNVWGSEIPYLKSVADPYETEPEQKAWTRDISLTEINACLARAGANIGSAKGVQITSRTNSGRVKQLTVLGSNGSYSVDNESIRTFFSSTSGGSLKSRLFSFTENVADALEGLTTGGSQSVTAISAAGKASLDAKNLVAISAAGKGVVAEQFHIQSATGKGSLSATGSATNVSTSLTTETVWGDLTISGVGFGHGVGMSQSGAKGMAKAGYDYKDILEYYYHGITID